MPGATAPDTALSAVVGLGMDRDAAGDHRGVSTPEPVTVVAPAFSGPTLMTQQWKDAGFLHWAVEPAAVEPLLPPGVHPDVHDGATYVGLIPFRMVGAGVGRGPSVPWAGTFLETNVRLYTVDDTGTRGIVFRSLDASRLVVVLGAQAAFGLPYRWARMDLADRRVARDGEPGREITYRTRTRTAGRHGSRVTLRVGAPLDAPDPLAEFLTARWGLHERHAGVGWYVPNVHGPWPLCHAEVVECDDGLVAAAGFPGLAARPPDSVLYSPGVDVRFGLPRPWSRSRRGPSGSAPSAGGGRTG